jgi:hypothetical protein
MENINDAKKIINGYAVFFFVIYFVYLFFEMSNLVNYHIILKKEVTVKDNEKCVCCPDMKKFTIGMICANVIVPILIAILYIMRHVRDNNNFKILIWTMIMIIFAIVLSLNIYHSNKVFNDYKQKINYKEQKNIKIDKSIMLGKKLTLGTQMLSSVILTFIAIGSSAFIATSI